MRDSPLQDDEFLLFATSFCIYFLEVDCGSDKLVRRARAWAEKHDAHCDAGLAEHLDPAACSVAVYYATVANVAFQSAVLILPVTLDTHRKGAAILTLEDLRDLYRARRSHR